MDRVEDFVTHTIRECLHLVIRLGQEQAFKAFWQEDAMSSIGMGSTVSNNFRYGAYPLLRQGACCGSGPCLIAMPLHTKSRYDNNGRPNPAWQPHYWFFQFPQRGDLTV
jgi:hypothetical protein